MSEIFYTGALPIPYDITIYQGATFSLEFEYKDGNDVAVDLTGYTAQMQIREENTHAVLLDLTTTAGITITAAVGKVGIIITAAQSAVLEAQNAEYDLLIKSSSGTVTYLLRGAFVITPRVTRMTI